MEGLQGARALVYNALSAPRPLMANSAGVRFDALLSLMARLRGEGGCPWDREQTRASLKPYLIEEAYEVLQAIDEDDTGHLAEELGDLLFQVVFHSQVAAEAGEFTMSDVLDRLIEKMTRRHPHVFGDQAVADAQDALRQWERIKRDEGSRAGEPRSALDGVPPSLPALLRAQRLQVKAARVGFDWPTWRQAWDKVREEVAEMDEALDLADGERIRHELGDVLFSVVNVARLLNVDAEDCLRQAADKFTRRFNEVETDMKARGRTVSDASAEELDQAWETVKAREPRDPSGTGR
jgi:tetrapyrrole methylase family protein / MazG family protein